MGNAQSFNHPFDSKNYNLVQCDKCYCYVTIPKNAYGNMCACGQYVNNKNPN
jgi:hypothetical protein